MRQDPTELMGGGFLGELREGPDGQLYQWVEGVDGLGNPVGFWRGLRRRLRSVVKRVAPLAQRAAGFIPGPYGAIASRALKTATPWLERAGLSEDGLGQLYEAPDGQVYQVNGLEDDDGAAPAGIGMLGDVRQGQDGHLYQWVETVNGLGEPVGFWKKFRRLARGLAKRAIPFAQKYAGIIPGYGTAISAGLKTASPWLRRAGIADPEFNGVGDGRDLEGLADDVEGLEADDLMGLENDEMAGAGPGGDLEGYIPPNAPPSAGQPSHFAPLW